MSLNKGGLLSTSIDSIYTICKRIIKKIFSFYRVFPHPNQNLTSRSHPSHRDLHQATDLSPSSLQLAHLSPTYSSALPLCPPSSVSRSLKYFVLFTFELQAILFKILTDFLLCQTEPSFPRPTLYLLHEVMELVCNLKSINRVCS